MGIVDRAREVCEVPAGMARLLEAIEAAGWRTCKVEHGEDSAGHRFVSVLASNGERKAQATWHSRPTNGKTLRLFSSMLFEPYVGWHHVTATALREAIRR